MTCREKLAMEHPECIDSDCYGGCEGCPNTYGYLPDPEWCGGGYDGPEPCVKCWGREIPEETPSASKEAVKEGEARVRGFRAGIGVYDEAIDSSPKILDSGDRTEFATGAVRDMREGKGRCDLLPLEVVYTYLSWFYKSSVLTCIHEIKRFQDTGNVEYLYRALKDFNTHHDWRDPYTMFLEVAKHFEEGCKKYGENNWRKGIPVKFYIDSALRHFFKYLRGDNDEPHDRAFCWYILCCIWTIENIKQEDDNNVGETDD